MDSHEQATIAYILQSTGKAYGTPLEGQPGDVERVQAAFQDATWILYTDKTFLFLPTSDSFLPISGTYLELFEYVQFQSPRDADTILASLPAEEVITIIPHEALLQIPFALLQDRHGRPLIMQHAIIYASSIATLRYTALNSHGASHPTSPCLLAFINPLPFADPQLPRLDALQQDFEHISTFYPQKTLFYGTDATKQHLAQETADYDVLCFATHTQAFSDEPFRSYLALAHVEEDDGYLRVPDIFALNLHTNLVVLLACETGKGKPTGDGVIGLSRAFTWAGTSSLLMSLWPIPEKESVYQIYLFHKYWLEDGHTKAHALRLAQLQCMRNYPLQPEVWSAFVLFGEWE